MSAVDGRNPVADVFFPKLSVHRIDPGASLFSTSEKIVAKVSPQIFIHELVRRYNRKNKEEVDGYKLIRQVDIEPGELSGFKFFLYRKETFTISNFEYFANIYGYGGSGSSNLHFVGFLVKLIDKVEKVWEVFALTSNNGWRVVKGSSDPDFALTIARRICLPELLESETVPIAGDKELVKGRYRNRQNLSAIEQKFATRIVENAKCEVKPGSSLSKLSFFKDKTPVFVIGKRCFSFNGHYPLAAYAELCNFCVEIIHKKKTFDLSGKEEEGEAAFENLQQIEPVQDKSLKKRLDKLILEDLWRMFSGDSALFGFYILPRFHTDFRSSTTFTFGYPSKVRKKSYLKRDWDGRPPSISEIVAVLKNAWYGCQKEEFFSLVVDCRLSFDVGNHSPSKLIRALVTDIRIGDNTYFHHQEKWHEMRVQHFAALQRSFYQNVLVSHLLDRGKVLPQPWFLKKEWTAFDPPAGKKAYLDKLVKQVFSFMDEKGKVLCSYVTKVLLEKISKSSHRNIKKKWMGLNLLLEKKCREKAILNPEELKKLFGDDGPAVYHALKENFPICTKKEKREKVNFLDGNGKLIKGNLELFDPGDRGIFSNEKMKKTLSDQLKDWCANDVVVTDQLVEEAVKKGKWSKQAGRSAKGIVKKLKEYVSVPRSSYILSGPSSESGDEEFDVFLKKQHENYRNVGDEEEYNRLYLNESGYLVCDQIYPAARIPVELWDVLYFGEEDKLYLIHVKASFGHSIRDLCSQVRISAEMVNQDLDSGKREILKKMYKGATGSSATSPFRKAVKEKFSQFTEEEFLALFDRKLVFVAAFLDTNSKEALLEEEKDSSFCFSSSSFSTDAAEGDKILQVLKKEEILDDKGRIGNKFYHLSFEHFETLFKKEFSGVKRIWILLNQKTSQFDSVVAKTELIVLQKTISKLSRSYKPTDFKVLQIARSGERPSRIEPLAFPVEREVAQIEKPFIERARVQLPKLSTEERVSSLRGKSPVGILNRNEKNCFINAALQFLLYSPLVERFLSNDHLVAGYDKERVSYFQEFCLAYALHEEGEEFHTAMMRHLFGFPGETQEDSREFIMLVAENYKLDGFFPISTKRTSLIDSKRVIEMSEEELFVHLPLPDGEQASLQGIIEAYFSGSMEADEIEFGEGKEKGFKELHSLKNDAEQLFFCLTWGGNTFSPKKQIKVLHKDNKITIGDQKYELQGYLSHHGERFSEGHYTACAKTGPDEWAFFDDERVVELNEEKFLGKVSTPYLIYLRRIPV